MTKPLLIDELVRLDREIHTLQQRAKAPAAGLSEHLVLEAARRMRLAITEEIAAPSAGARTTSLGFRRRQG